MGSPLAPALANIFMGFYESNWLIEYNINKPIFYWWYVDDILAAFDNEQDSIHFLDFLNKRHPKIKFTLEKQKLIILSLFLMYSFKVSIIKISHFKHIINRPIQTVS